MKFLIYGFIFTVAVWSNGYSSEELFDLDSIRSLDGRVYHDILILDGDEHGLMFRHRKGIAKIPFRQLSMNLRMLYEPVGEVEKGSEVDSTEDNEPAQSGKKTAEAMTPLEARAVASLSGPEWWIRGAFTQIPRSRVAPWPQHWPRYHPAHALAYPHYRELAVRDFLYTTGLAERPPGVHPYPIQRHGPYCFH